MMHQKKIALDIGGSHVTACILNMDHPEAAPEKIIRRHLDAGGSAEAIISSIATCIQELQDSSVSGIGIAVPGPFDHRNGICAIANVGGKFGSMFGLHLKQALQDAAATGDLPLQFFNDAHCFAAGALKILGLQGESTVLLTLGTGFGSSFLRNGELATAGDGIPASGAYYDMPFLEAAADDYFSSRWLLAAFHRNTGIRPATVKEMAEQYTAQARPVFEQFGDHLGSFLLPQLQAFGCRELVIGGNIARSWNLFAAPLLRKLEPLGIAITCCTDTEHCILAGAALSAHEPGPAQLRQTRQLLLPAALPPHNDAAYTIFPSFHTSSPVQEGYDSLAKLIAGERVVILDGYNGVLWEHVRAALHTSLRAQNKTVRWYHTGACLHAPAVIENMLQENMNAADPVFGKRYEGSLADFFDLNLLLQIEPGNGADIHIIYGTGAALTAPEGLLLYIDVPKNEIQYRLRAGSITNIGTPTYTYKRCYFTDWPVLSKHKQDLLPYVDVIIDGQRPGTITWMQGDDFRAELDNMLTAPFRARPWFEAGVWGGNWMKQHLPGLPPEEVNYAWSFELITPENGIVLAGAGLLLEVSFDFLLFRQHHKLLGKAATRFGTAFPIRFDFLDTFDGGNLSIQCHPRPAFTKEHFGEDFTQDETYYILDCEPDAQVYLGFQENISPEKLRGALEDALNRNIPLPVEQYIQQFTAQKHDLFLIPNGTVHASGKNNLVLEISSTPYIFTFKMYDWLRKDLNGRPRPIHLDHAFANLHFDRKGDMVPATLISRPHITDEWANGKKWQLPTHPEHFYTVDRYAFTGEVTIQNLGQCHICMLVEGDRIQVTGSNGQQTFHYAETFVVPAAAGHYTCRYEGKGTAMLVVAYVKDNYC
ncbi:ROK family protein [Chitinophaga sp. Mgbs1]|uniref:fructokinase n=1 Tax=Chitinophaga solisilvae TaxID=1233460 RepID=A0A433WC38_9BACT|nr:ROK family protein [Chitinophaga solisilvae]